MRIIHTLLGLLLLGSMRVKGDTEIINFSLDPSSASRSPKTYAEKSNSSTINLSPSSSTTLSLEHDQIHQIKFDTSLMTKYQKWTIRISWSASTPTEIRMTTPGIDSDKREGHFTIFATPLSPPVPPLTLNHLPTQLQFMNRLSFIPFPNLLFSTSSEVELGIISSTTVNIILEPLIFGVIPQTALYAIAFILIFMLGAILIVRPIFRLMDWSTTLGTYDDKPVPLNLKDE